MPCSVASVRLNCVIRSQHRVRVESGEKDVHGRPSVSDANEQFCDNCAQELCLGVDRLGLGSGDLSRLYISARDPTPTNQRSSQNSPVAAESRRSCGDSISHCAEPHTRSCHARNVDDDEIRRPPQTVVRPIHGHLGGFERGPPAFLQHGHDRSLEAERDRRQNRRIVLSDEANEGVCRRRFTLVSH